MLASKAGPSTGVRVETLSLGSPLLLGLPYIMVAEMEEQACQERKSQAKVPWKSHKVTSCSISSLEVSLLSPTQLKGRGIRLCLSMGGLLTLGKYAGFISCILIIITPNISPCYSINQLFIHSANVYYVGHFVHT